VQPNHRFNDARSPTTNLRSVILLAENFSQKSRSTHAIIGLVAVEEALVMTTVQS
jgi:hypothetical protein